MPSFDDWTGTDPSCAPSIVARIAQALVALPLQLPQRIRWFTRQLRPLNGIVAESESWEAGNRLPLFLASFSGWLTGVVL